MTQCIIESLECDALATLPATFCIVLEVGPMQESCQLIFSYLKISQSFLDRLGELLDRRGESFDDAQVSTCVKHTFDHHHPSVPRVRHHPLVVRAQGRAVLVAAGEAGLATAARERARRVRALALAWIEPAMWRVAEWR